MTATVERGDIERFRAAIARRFGFQYDDGKLEYLAEVLRRRMEAVDCHRFDAYVNRLTEASTKNEELSALAEQLAVSETFFFRNADHFRAFKEVVLRDRLQARRRDKRLRVLSAGCASGEEAFSLAISIRETLPDLGSWDVHILGVDINRPALAKAAQARYSAWSLRATPEAIKQRYFQAAGRDFVLDPAVRRMVTFEERNLVEGEPLFWRSLSCDVVFCRNVLMYFRPEIMDGVVRRMSDALLPDGYLFLGHAETLRGLSHDFHLCQTHDTFYYRKRGASELQNTTPARAGRSDTWIGDVVRAVEPTASWVDAIQRASTRITELTDGRARRVTRRAIGSSPPRSWDLGLVLELLRKERFADALDVLDALPPDSHDDPDALLLRAVLLTNNGHLVASEELCTRLLGFDELNAGAHYLMALCREHAGDREGAVKHDEAAVHLDAGFAIPHLHLGLLARRSGNAAVARRELGQALILLAREDASRLLLFGGGFSREMLVSLCRTELSAVGGET